MRASRTIAGLVAAAFLCLATADEIKFVFPISGDQVVPPVNTTGVGIGEVTLDTDSLLLSWVITYKGLMGEPRAAHFHGPAARGKNAGVRLGFDDPKSPIEGKQIISKAWAKEIIDGLWYVNIHTASYPGGEIRGQVEMACDGCDANCDGSVDLTDVEPFIVLLLEGGKPCSECAGDTNGDGSVDLTDVEQFIVCLLG